MFFNIEYDKNTKNKKFGKKVYRREYMKKYWQIPEHKEKEKLRRKTPEYKENHKLHAQLYNQKPEVKERRRKYYQNPEQKEKNRYKLKAVFIESISILSHGTMSCAVCGESRIDGLTADHIHGGGTKQVRDVGGHFHYWFKINGFPDKDKYQVLCMNCQHEKVITNNENRHIKTPTQEQQKKRDRQQKWQDKLRWETLSAYSDSPIPYCNVCHTTNIWHLCLDHVNDDGAEDRKKYGNGLSLYCKLRQLNYPNKDKYQVLCFTCNHIKMLQNCEHNGAVIPHLATSNI